MPLNYINTDYIEPPKAETCYICLILYFLYLISCSTFLGIEGETLGSGETPFMNMKMCECFIVSLCIKTTHQDPY